MPFYNTPMTKLEAVNICLSSMGEPTVNSLDSAAIDAQMASDIVDETARSVQAIGWHWNREKHTIEPDGNGYLTLPANTLRVDTAGSYVTTDVIQRGTRLYNRGDDTYIFSAPLELDMYVALPFEDMPFAAKQFVSIRSARLLQQRVLGSDTLYKFDSADENRAWTVLCQEEAEVSDANMLYDNWSTSSIMNRSSFSRGAY